MPCVTKWAGWSRTCAVRSRARIKSLDARLRHHLHTVTCSALNALLTEFGLAPHPHLVVAVEGQTELVLFARNAKLGVPSDDDFIVAEDAGAPTATFRHWSQTLWRHASSARVKPRRAAHAFGSNVRRHASSSSSTPRANSTPSHFVLDLLVGVGVVAHNSMHLLGSHGSVRQAPGQG
jgi:hypothetical protein